MARAEQKAKIGELQRQSDLSPVPLQPTCLRCGGLMVKEVSMDLRNMSELECATRRCVQCGDVVDSVILRNRHIPHDQTMTHRAGKSLQSKGLN